MANLTGSNFNNLKPGLLNIATNDVPTSKGLPTDGSAVFVEDGFGVKSGLKLGAEVVECVEPTTRTGVVNVAFADRTYANIEELKLAITAIEVYRENTQRDFTESIEPLVNRVAEIESSINQVQGATTINQEAISTLQTANLSVRVTDIEDKYLSKLGGTFEGVLSFAESSRVNMNGKSINSLGIATQEDQAVTLGQVNTLVAGLQAQIDNLQTQINTFHP